MKVEISLPEVREIFNEIQKQPQKLYEMIRSDIQVTVGEYLSALIKAELADFLGRKPYEREAGSSNHRNGSYTRRFALKCIGNVAVQVPLDRKGEFATKVIPKSKQYEEEIARDLSLMYLAGVIVNSGV
jgi:putative transposase